MAQEQNLPIGNNNNSFNMKVADVEYRCSNLAEAKAAQKMAKELMKHRPIEVKIGKHLTIKGNTKDFVIAVVVVLTATGVYYKYIRPLKKNAPKNETPEPTPPLLLDNRDKKVKVKTLNSIGSSSTQMPVQILGQYVYEGDIAWFFSITNSGKTILGLEGGISLASGTCPSFLPEGTTPVKRRVIYLNFQMREDQLKKRYFGNVKDMRYPDGLEIIFCNGLLRTIKSLGTFMAKLLENATESIVIFVDTVRDVKPNFSANDADELNTMLKNIQVNYKKRTGNDITYILVGQTNKKNIYTPIELEDMSGSFNLAQLADSVNAICPTRFGMHVSFLKCLKGRVDDPHNKYPLLTIKEDPYVRPVFSEYVAEDDVLPIRQTKKNTVQSHLRPNEPIVKSDEINDEGIPRKIIEEMAAWYQKGTNGYGLEATIEVFDKKYQIKEKYGLQYAMQLKRLFEKSE